MAEEFEGNMPEIKITTPSGYAFFYECAEVGIMLDSPCSERSPLSENCFDCIGFNRRFAKYFQDNRNCACGWKVGFAYFMLIFHFEKAGLLPKDFKMQCCSCYHHDVNHKIRHPTCDGCADVR